MIRGKEMRPEYIQESVVPGLTRNISLYTLVNQQYFHSVDAHGAIP